MGTDASGKAAATPAAPLRLGRLRLGSRLAIELAAASNVRTALERARLNRAGLVVLPAAGAADAVDWMHRRCLAAVGLRVDTQAPPAVADRAARAGFDVLVAPRGAPAARAWPSDRVLMAAIATPADSQGPAADALLDALRTSAVARTLVVGVAAGDGDAVEALLLCDRVVQELGLPCAAVDLLANDDAVATALLAGRVQLVLTTDITTPDRNGVDYQ